MYIEHIDENSKRIRIWEGDPEPLAHTVAAEEFRDTYPLLSGIELYQDTYFNTRQIERLIKELQRFKKEVQPDAHEQVNSLIDFSEKIDTHQYLRFVGD